ncbi:chemotaxis protein CheW [Rhizobium sp. BK491]|uniref:chemotaxis protein CheW n=1 Tax=Rhizobium sp. BK491 TaxID=2587009 RepID=UPI0016191F6B|nr:chemotaxis protein CheW [Rhizobium sp. BK491]MBB3571741.1 purine-binding chemotaxis protein CheW [Rhizobium sp. BK491]
MRAATSAAGHVATLGIVAFHLGDQQFCIKTTSIREIRGWAAATSLRKSARTLLALSSVRGRNILAIRVDQVQPAQELGTSFNPNLLYGIIPLERGEVYFLNLDHMFERLEERAHAA